MVELSQLQYKPQSPERYLPDIGVIGCGGISHHHLMAYRDAGFKVTHLCDINRDAAERRQREFFPDANVCEDYHRVLSDPEVEVVDITTHPPERPAIIEAALLAGKHVLSQKPFVLDLVIGRRLVEIAKQQGCYLAVNQNARWAPHFSYARQVVRQEAIGKVFAAHMSCHWDHTWVEGTEFEQVRHLILYDYAIHWFDMLRCLLGDAKRVFASNARVPGQTLAPDLLGQAVVEFDNGQATLAFDGGVPQGPHERTFLSGTAGTLHSYGTGNQDQTVYVTREDGCYSPKLEGKWFPTGFHGTMGELLCAIEQKRPCLIAAEDNLDSLALCFAALESADRGEALIPGQVNSVQI
ncbi:MAG: Gfo/Idh/MocA family protein [Aureliella sp.]